MAASVSAWAAEAAGRAEARVWRMAAAAALNLGDNSTHGAGLIPGHLAAIAVSAEGHDVATPGQGAGDPPLSHPL